MIKCLALLSIKIHMRHDLISRDLQHVWHPCTNMKDFDKNPPLIVQNAKGSYIYTDQGPLIDAISSWWCKSLGHGHPAVLAGIRDQLNQFEQIITANTTHPLVVELAEKLTDITQLQHIFFASDGSCAVEIAMKLAIYSSKLKGYKDRRQFVALKHGYHGETLGTMSVSDLNLYKEPYADFNIPCHFLDPIPYVTNQHDPAWQSCDSQQWSLVLNQLNAIKDSTHAIIFEPIIQGAGGMQCYSADFLSKLAAWAKQHDIYLIADEIMTGLGRTGEWLACHHAKIQPDMICLSKGLTSGSIPMSCVMIDHSIYDLCYAAKIPFLHSHTFGGNPLAISAALATLHTMETEGINEQAQKLGELMQLHFNKIMRETGKLTRIRSIGAVIAADLVGPKQAPIGYHLAQQAQKRGALLRPLGNTLYWLPPLTTDEQTIQALAEITFDAIEAVYQKDIIELDKTCIALV